MGQNDQERAELILNGIRKIKLLMKKIMTGFSPDMEPSGLNVTHHRTLLLLENRGDLCMKEICCDLGIEAGSFTPVADKLTEKGLLVRIPDSRDRRRTLLSLTEEGRVFTDELKGKMGEYMTRRLAHLESEQVDRFLEALQVIDEVNRALEANSDGQ
ncbi:MAG: MarR family transcriptional regulator [Spirochaetales bacterium]|nr:MarR family transcriptional regulator [Spirochaetales bacterium]